MLKNMPEKIKPWVALGFLSLGLAIVIIDNTVLNVALPYIIIDLKTSLNALEWVVSGYALIIATLLITMGRLGDLYGRKKIFLIGAVIFGTGSFIASIAPTVLWLFIGEALIEAVGASMMLTSSLALVAEIFSGKQRAIAFGVWGSVAGAASALGPLLGGFLTTYYSWRWSLRINVFVVLITLFGALFIPAHKNNQRKKLDIPSVVLSGLSLFTLVFAIIEGERFGWFRSAEILTLGNWRWPWMEISFIPFVFIAAVVFIFLFIRRQKKLAISGGEPLLKLSLFKERNLSFGLVALFCLAAGQIGLFFLLPVFLQRVFDLSAFSIGKVFLMMSLPAFVVGPLGGFLTRRFGVKKMVLTGLFFLLAGLTILTNEIGLDARLLHLLPGLLVFGIGIGLSSAQLTNLIVSAAPLTLAGEASAANATVRQIGAAVGIAIFGLIFSLSFRQTLVAELKAETAMPPVAKYFIVSSLEDPALSRRLRTELQRSSDGGDSLMGGYVKIALARAGKTAVGLTIVPVLFAILAALKLKEKTSG